MPQHPPPPCGKHGIIPTDWRCMTWVASCQTLSKHPSPCSNNWQFTYQQDYCPQRCQMLNHLEWLCSWGHLDCWHASSTVAWTSLVMGSSRTPTFHLHSSKQFQFLLLLAKFCTCPNIIVVQEKTLSKSHFIEHSLSIMYSCTFGIHVKKATVAHKSITLVTTLNHLFRHNMPDTLKTYVGTQSIQEVQESDSIWPLHKTFFQLQFLR
jgi:hypothetical protein